VERLKQIGILLNEEKEKQMKEEMKNKEQRDGASREKGIKRKEVEIEGKREIEEKEEK
jgi:hypothetical protein